MAEQLGTAVLSLEVDLKPLREGLEQARRLIESGASGAERRVRQSSAGTRRVTGGARENTRALEIAQERRFRLARRIDALEERGANVARLRQRLGALTEAQTRRQFGTFRQIGQALAREVVLSERRQQSVEKTRRAEQQLAAIGARAGGARESVFALERAQDRRFRLSQRINRLEERGVNVDRLRTRLGELTESQSRRQFGSFRQQSRELARQLSLTEARYRRERDTQRLAERAARIGGPRSPIGGSVNIAGSPAFLRAQRQAAEQAIERSIRAGGPASPITGRLFNGTAVAGSPAQLADEQRRQLAESRRIQQEERRIAQDRRRQLAEQRRAQRQRDVEIRRLARAGGPALPVSGRLIDGTAVEGSPAFLRAQRRAAGGRISGPSLPLSGRLADGSFAPGSPGDLRQRRQLSLERGRARSGALSSGVIGGAFPLLFGQGLGASIGGGLGGALGGALGGQFGFGLSLVGTAIGQFVDTLNQRFNSLSPVLVDAAAAIDVVRENSLLASRSQEAYAQALIDSGRAAQATLEIQREVFRTVDPTALATTAASSEALNRAFSDTKDLLGNIVSGPAQGFQSWLAGVLGLLNRVPEGAAAIGSPQSRRNAQNLEFLSAGALSAGVLAAAGGFAVGGPIGSGIALAGTGLAATGGFGVAGAQQRQRVNSSADVLSSQQAVERSLTRQVSLEKAISTLRAQGKSSLSGQLQDLLAIEKARTSFLTANRDINVGIASGNLSSEEGRKQFNDEFRRLKITEQDLVSGYREREAASAKELSNVRALAGYTGRALEAQRERLRVTQAETDLRQKETQLLAFTRANPNAGGNDSRLRVLQSARNEAANNAAKTQIEAATRINDLFKATQETILATTRSLQDAVSSLLALQGNPNAGLNQFLSPEASRFNVEGAYNKLRPQFDAAVSTAIRSAEASNNRVAASEFRDLRRRFGSPVSAGFIEAGGQRTELRSSPQLVGDSFAKTNAFFQQFIDAQRSETRLREDISRTNAELAQAQTDLATITGELIAPTSGIADLLPSLRDVITVLADKSWAVQVNVAADGSSQAFGDVLAGATSP